MIERQAYPYFDCEQCGHIGLVSQLKEHPLRPVPDDLGFCPECGSEVRDLETEATIRETLASYEEDADAYLAKLKAENAP